MDKVQHFEIPVDDVVRARTFYKTVFDWKTMEFPMPDGSQYVGLYTVEVDEKTHLAKEPGAINGGMFKRGGGLPITTPTIAIVVADIEAAVASVITNGGSVVMPTMSMGGMGLYAYVKDTEGNVIGVWQELKKS